MRRSTTLERLPGEPPGPGDLSALIEQLGYLRYTPLRVICRDRAARPQVVLSFFALPPVAPAFTTNLFWVTGTGLRSGIDRLEAGGLAFELKTRMLADERLKEGFLADQLEYCRLATALYRELLDESPPRSQAFGVGGVRSLEQVKCLHAHVAFHLATGRSWIGAQVAGLLAAELVPP